MDKDFKVSKTVSLPTSIWDKVDEAAYRKKMSRSEYLLSLVLSDLGSKSNTQPLESAEQNSATELKPDTQQDAKQPVEPLSEPDDEPVSNLFARIADSLGNIDV